MHVILFCVKGLINAIPNSEELGSMLHNTGVLIIQHISKISQSIMINTQNNSNNREVILITMDAKLFSYLYM